MTTDLPLPPRTGRWTAASKEALVLRLRRRQLTIAQACEQFGLSVEEIDGWLWRYKAGGQAALRVKATTYTHGAESLVRI